MLLARRNNDSDWLSNFFDDTLFNTEVMPRMNATAPAINIKETDKNYIMEVAAPGLKKYLMAFRLLTVQTLVIRPSFRASLIHNGCS